MATVAGSRIVRANIWAFVPATLLVSLIGFQLWLVRNAVSDPSFVVEDGYYAKAVSWNATMAQERENARLGFSLDVQVTPDADRNSRVIVRLVARDGTPITGAMVTGEAFFVARANKPVAATFSERDRGSYEASLRTTHSGLWEFRFAVQRGAERFTHVVRRDVASTAGTRP